ncbi:hypothetical protein Pmani_013388 [Petrolisthes manimaculis]|uniref:Uncharacterized protein n=1 Tax=Petrolisthes manimaculis TaxID=1843537 RepID=A0AAE1PW92_9EUCA|nr:hypothetical protein Pmani_013388 [Petrolisthes manimaculis]
MMFLRDGSDENCIHVDTPRKFVIYLSSMNNDGTSPYYSCKRADKINSSNTWVEMACPAPSPHWRIARTLSPPVSSGPAPMSANGLYYTRAARALVE